MWIWLVIYILTLVLNAVLSFLPNRLQAKKLIRSVAIAVAIFILVRGVYQEIDHYRNRSFACVTPKGQITKSNNFPWKITHFEPSEESVYFIFDKRSDGSEVTVTPDDSTYEANVSGVTAGVCIKFDCAPFNVPRFRIDVKH